MQKIAEVQVFLFAHKIQERPFKALAKITEFNEGVFLQMRSV